MLISKAIYKVNKKINDLKKKYIYFFDSDLVWLWN